MKDLTIRYHTGFSKTGTLIPIDIDTVCIQIKRFGDLMLRTKDNFCTFSDVMGEIRVAENRQLQNQLKYDWLNVVFFNGLFNYVRSPDDYSLAYYSSCTLLEFGNIRSQKQQDALAEELKQTPYVIGFYHSPTSLALKVIVKHDNRDPSRHRQLYKQLCGQFDKRLLSSSSWQLARWNYIYNDPNMYVNPNPVAFHFVP